MKQEYTRQELADIREQELDQWFDNKFDSELEELRDILTGREIYDLKTKNMVSWTLHKNRIEIKDSKGVTSFLYLTNPTNSFVAQMIINLHKDKEVK